MEITDSLGNEILFSVTKEDLEGISDILTDGRWDLKKTEEKKKEKLEREEEMKKLRSTFSVESSIAEILKAKLDSAFTESFVDNLEGKEESDGN